MDKIGERRERAYSQGVADEDLGLSELVLLLDNVLSLHDLLATVLGGASEVGPGGLAEHLVALKELLVLLTVAETGTLDTDVLKKTIRGREGKKEKKKTINNILRETRLLGRGKELHTQGI